jgi:hypothetical protein
MTTVEVGLGVDLDHSVCGGQRIDDPVEVIA